MDNQNMTYTEDKRFKQCNKELWVTLSLFVVNLVIVGGTALILGLNKPAKEMSFILGFPAWFFWSGVVGVAIFCCLPYFMIKYFFKEMSIEAEEGEENV